MDLAHFETRARAMWEEVPDRFLDGVDGLVVSPDTASDPERPNVRTLGECITDVYPSDWQGPETVRSLLVLYHGSFVAVASDRPSFDWDGELWETITHELRHHLESLADEDALEGVDYALDHEARRYAGEPFDPLYYRWGERRADGMFQVEKGWYLEIEQAESAPAPLRFEWAGGLFETLAPATGADIAFLDVYFPDRPDNRTSDELLTVVLVRPKRWTSTLGAAISGRESTVVAFEVEARVV